MKQIHIYNISQYTKKGKLKKNAQHEMGLTIADVEPQTEKDKLYNDNYIAKTIKQRGYKSFTSPYFFTHIDCLNDKGERCLIFETLFIGSDNKEICTTPKTLFNNLTK
jgi:hypothetical protein